MIEPGERVLVAVSGGKDSLGLWQLLRATRLRRRRPLHRLGNRRRTPTRPARTLVRSRRRSRGHLHRGRPSLRSRLRRRDRRRAPPSARRAARAACRSATSSTRPRSTTATTCSRPATTSTTRPRCCSATCCAGTPATSAASIRCCPRRPASRARSSRSSGSASASSPRTACSPASTTSSRSARWRSGNRHLGYKETLDRDRGALTGHEGRVPLRLLRARATRGSRATPREERDDLGPCSQCGAPTPGDLCAFCRLQARATGRPIPVTVADGSA